MKSVETRIFGMALKHKLLSVDDLQPHPNNPRQGDVGAISQSLEAHGQYKPIVVNERDMTILAGNHTWQAAQALGWDKIATVLVDVDDEEAKRILLVDNRTNDLASYDDFALTDLLSSLAGGTELGLEGTGWDGDDLDDLLVAISFDPIDEEQPRLDERSPAEPVTCPECGHSFSP